MSRLYIKLHKDIIDLVADGKLSVLEEAVYIRLYKDADLRTGSGMTNAKRLMAQLPEHSEHALGRALASLEKKRHIFRKIKHGSKLPYPYWINAFEITSGTKRQRMTDLSKVFETKDPDHVIYVYPAEEGAEEVRRKCGGGTEEGAEEAPLSVATNPLAAPKKKEEKRNNKEGITKLPLTNRNRNAEPNAEDKAEPNVEGYEHRSNARVAPNIDTAKPNLPKHAEPMPRYRPNLRKIKYVGGEFVVEGGTGRECYDLVVRLAREYGLKLQHGTFYSTDGVEVSREQALRIINE